MPSLARGRGHHGIVGKDRDVAQAYHYKTSPPFHQLISGWETELKEQVENIDLDLGE